MNLLYYLKWLPITIFVLLGGCAAVPAHRPPDRVILKHPCEVRAPEKPGEHYFLTYHGLEIISDGAPPPVCRLPKGAIFSIDLLRVGTAGGMIRAYARGSVNSRGHDYPVEMYLHIAENPGILQAVYDEIAKDSNRFWTVCKP